MKEDSSFDKWLGRPEGDAPASQVVHVNQLFEVVRQKFDRGASMEEVLGDLRESLAAAFDLMMMLIGPELTLRSSMSMFMELLEEAVKMKFGEK